METNLFTLIFKNNNINEFSNEMENKLIIIIFLVALDEVAIESR